MLINDTQKAYLNLTISMAFVVLHPFIKLLVVTEITAHEIIL